MLLMCWKLEQYVKKSKKLLQRARQNPHNHQVAEEGQEGRVDKVGKAGKVEQAIQVVVQVVEGFKKKMSNFTQASLMLH